MPSSFDTLRLFVKEFQEPCLQANGCRPSHQRAQLRLQFLRGVPVIPLAADVTFRLFRDGEQLAHVANA